MTYCVLLSFTLKKFIYNFTSEKVSFLISSQVFCTYCEWPGGSQVGWNMSSKVDMFWKLYRSFVVTDGLSPYSVYRSGGLREKHVVATWNALMVPNIPSCHYMLLMWPSGLKFVSNRFHVLFTCKITTDTGWQPNCS